MAHDPSVLLISELFYSIQGESTFAGLPCVFIRLAGCNLRCRYCDASYTYEEKSETKTIDELLDYIAGYSNSPVEVTGGEPLLQDETIHLLEKLIRQGRTVLLETNGSLPLAPVPPEVIKIIDVKCPDSGMAGSFLEENIASMQEHDELKFVLSSRRDFQWATAFIDRHGLFGKKLLFSPVQGSLDPALLAAWLLAERLNIRLQLQLHKILWPKQHRGI